MIEVVWPGVHAARAPEVTFWVQCYAHERYVAESVRSALAQTHRSLEVIVSDDCSPDATFDVAARAVHDYRGPHRVTLLRSEHNRGSFAHIDEVIPHVRGALVVWQSSDDVADPRRAEQLAAAASRRGASGAWSNHRLIDDAGRDEGLGLAEDAPYRLALEDYAAGRFLDFTYGGTLCVSRRVFDVFGALPQSLPSSGIEHVLGFRAALLGRFVYLAEPLVRRRRHAGSLTEGFSSRDRAGDPLECQTRRILRRLDVLTVIRAHLERKHRGLRVRRAKRLSASLLEQIGHEVRRLAELRSFLARRARVGDPSSRELRHAALVHEPPALVLLGAAAPGLNRIAFEGMYHAVPQALGPVEPCGLRNHRYPGVLSAWSEVELDRLIAAG